MTGPHQSKGLSRSSPLCRQFLLSRSEFRFPSPTMPRNRATKTKSAFVGKEAGVDAAVSKRETGGEFLMTGRSRGGMAPRSPVPARWCSPKPGLPEYLSLHIGH